jgi:hypothetical protein
MRSPFILFSAFIILFCSCSGKKEQKTDNENDNVPEALQEEKKSVFSLSKGRGHQDIIEKLYEELVKETPALQDLEKSIQEVNNNRQDSTRLFAEFDQKNNSYYTTSEQYINSITDSALKQHIRTLIGKSLEKYNYQVQPNKALTEIIAGKGIRLSDLHTVLKLTKTVSVMEKYQQTSLPSPHPLQAVNREYDMVIEKTKKLAAN